MQYPLKVQLFDSLQEFKRPRSLALAGILSAFAVVLNGPLTFSVSPVLEIGFGFAAVAMCAYFCGPWVAGTAGVGIDLLSYILRPNGAFFPGFTLNEFIIGFLYGLWLYKRKPATWQARVFLCVGAYLCNVLLINYFLTPLWLHIMYGSAFKVLSQLKLIKTLLKSIVDLPLLVFITVWPEKIERQFG